MDLVQLRKAAHQLVSESHARQCENGVIQYLSETQVEGLPAGAIHLDELITITSRFSGGDAVQIHETILLVEACLRNPSAINLGGDVKESIIKLQQRVVSTILPPPIFAAKSSFDPDPTPAFSSSQEDIVSWRSIGTIGLRLLCHLHDLTLSLSLPQQQPMPIVDLDLDFITCLASFTGAHDSWTTPEAYKYATNLLQTLMGPDDDKAVQDLLAALLEKKVKPLFTKTKNPAITAQGRKAIHPLPAAPDFSDSEVEIKPWKFRAAYIITVFGWILGHLDGSALEESWPRVVPPLLALLDDEATDNKIRGCDFLLMLLKITPSSLLERTGLGDVFYNALIPCLSYLPTLTPEEESLRLLTAVYPTLVALVKTRFSTKNSPAKMRSFDSILRTGVVKGYAQAGENVKIAEFLVYRMADLVDAMGIYSVKHLKDVVPLLVDILSSPFSTSYPPLIRAAAHTLNVIILNDWPRISYYRGDVLKGTAICWLSIHEDWNPTPILQDAACDLQKTVGLLKVAMGTAGIDVTQEITMLITSNTKLYDLLQS